MEKRIYTCATAHLDTIWNWDFEHVVSVCLYNTLVKNFRLFEEFPDYTFNFEGSYRYELFEEYYPALFEQLKTYVADGRWNVAGSSYENGDVNVPSPEALFRNILYGNSYFMKTFGKKSNDIFLPDCFGFGWALPSVIRHANLKGFTTQKLTWGSAYGIPFDIGKWYGSDGKYCFACTNPGAYVHTYKKVRGQKDNRKKLAENESKYALPWTFSFHGAGDQGGAPKKRSVQTLEREMALNASESVKILSASSSQVYDDLDRLTEEQKNKLPAWKNELLMTDHAVGGYTSRAVGKRWNRKCEELADMTERTAVLGTYLGGMKYPHKTLERAWKRTIAHQFHDDIPGTSVQRAYLRSWNDYVLSMNQFENEYSHSVSTVSKALDTSWVQGTPVVVSNTLERERRGLVRISLSLSKNSGVKVYDFSGAEMPSQVLSENATSAVVAFVSTIPALGYKVFDIRECEKEIAFTSPVKASTSCLENDRLLVTLNDNGDISSIVDKKNERELLQKPITHQIIDYYGSIAWPAWELTYKSVASKQYVVPEKKSVQILYQGNACAALKVVQTYGSSTFTSVISLINGGDMVEVQNEIDWWQTRKLLKDRFSLTVSNEKAAFDLGLGVIERGNATKTLYEVPAQKWTDISNDTYGVSILSDSKYGWDKQDDSTLRMTVVHTPRRNFSVENRQSLMEIGLNRYGFAVFPHESTDLSGTQLAARKFNQPLSGIITDIHKGALGSEYSFGTLSDPAVILRCLKKAEASDEIVVRFNEGAGNAAKTVSFTLGAGIESAREIYASEETLTETAFVKDGNLIFDLDPYGIKSFALTLKAPPCTLEQPDQKEFKLEGNFVIFRPNKDNAPMMRTGYKQLRLPEELNPGLIICKGIRFHLNPKTALSCRGQKLHFVDSYEKLYLLAASYEGDREAEFLIGKTPVTKTIHSIEERIGGWDLAGMRETAFIKSCTLAHEFTHAHTKEGNDIVAKQLYLFCYEFDIRGAGFIQFPQDNKIVILAATGVNGDTNGTISYPLYDRISKRKFIGKFKTADHLSQLTGYLPHNLSGRAKLIKRVDGLKIK